MSRNGVGERGGRCNLRSRSRDDVAAFISATLLDPDLNRTAIQVTAGDIRVHEATARLAPRPLPQIMGSTRNAHTQPRSGRS